MGANSGLRLATNMGYGVATMGQTSAVKTIDSGGKSIARWTWLASSLVLLACAQDRPKSEMDHSAVDGGDAFVPVAMPPGNSLDSSMDGHWDLDGGPSKAMTDGGGWPLDATLEVDASIGPDAGNDAHPESEFCGDGVRDPVLEACDDGDQDGAACTGDCNFAPTYLLEPQAPLDGGMTYDTRRSLGSSAHPLDGDDERMLAVYVEQTPTAMVKAQMMTGNGVRLGPAISLGGQPAGMADPAVALLPSGDFVVAWTDLTLGTPDVVLQRIGRDGELAGGRQVAHEQISGPQEQVDLIWSGEELVVAWTGLLEVRYRLFNEDLSALDATQTLTSLTEFASGVTLARTAQGWAAAFVTIQQGLQRIVTITGTARYETALAAPSPTADRPVLALLDDDTLLLAYTLGTDPEGTGTANTSRLRLATLESKSTGAAAPHDLVAVDGPFNNDPRLNQSAPSLVRVGDVTLLAWQQQSPIMDPQGEEALIYELKRDAEPNRLLGTWRDFGQNDEDDQRNPTLSGTSLYPGGAIALLWEKGATNQNQPAGGDADPDLGFALRPVPFVMASSR